MAISQADRKIDTVDLTQQLQNTTQFHLSVFDEPPSAQQAALLAQFTAQYYNDPSSANDFFTQLDPLFFASTLITKIAFPEGDVQAYWSFGEYDFNKRNSLKSDGGKNGNIEFEWVDIYNRDAYHNNQYKDGTYVKYSSVRFKEYKNDERYPYSPTSTDSTLYKQNKYESSPTDGVSNVFEENNSYINRTKYKIKSPDQELVGNGMVLNPEFMGYYYYVGRNVFGNPNLYNDTDSYIYNFYQRQLYCRNNLWNFFENPTGEKTSFSISFWLKGNGKKKFDTRLEYLKELGSKIKLPQNLGTLADWEYFYHFDEETYDQVSGPIEGFNFYKYHPGTEVIMGNPYGPMGFCLHQDGPFWGGETDENKLVFLLQTQSDEPYGNNVISSNPIKVEAQANLPSGEWNHIAIVHDGVPKNIAKFGEEPNFQNSLSIYVNGTKTTTYYDPKTKLGCKGFRYLSDGYERPPNDEDSLTPIDGFVLNGIPSREWFDDVQPKTIEGFFSCTGDGSEYLKFYGGSANSFAGLGFWSRALSPTDIFSLYNFGVGIAPRRYQLFTDPNKYIINYQGIDPKLNLKINNFNFSGLKREEDFFVLSGVSNGQYVNKSFYFKYLEDYNRWIILEPGTGGKGDLPRWVSPEAKLTRIPTDRYVSIFSEAEKCDDLGGEDISGPEQKTFGTPYVWIYGRGQTSLYAGEGEWINGEFQFPEKEEKEIYKNFSFSDLILDTDKSLLIDEDANILNNYDGSILALASPAASKVYIYRGSSFNQNYNYTGNNEIENELQYVGEALPYFSCSLNRIVQNVERYGNPIPDASRPYGAYIEASATDELPYEWGVDNMYTDTTVSRQSSPYALGNTLYDSSIYTGDSNGNVNAAVEDKSISNFGFAMAIDKSSKFIAISNPKLNKVNVYDLSGEEYQIFQTLTPTTGEFKSYFLTDGFEKFSSQQLFGTTLQFKNDYNLLYIGAQDQNDNMRLYIYVYSFDHVQNSFILHQIVKTVSSTRNAAYADHYNLLLKSTSIGPTVDDANLNVINALVSDTGVVGKIHRFYNEELYIGQKIYGWYNAYVDADSIKIKLKQGHYPSGFSAFELTSVDYEDFNKNTIVDVDTYFKNKGINEKPLGAGSGFIDKNGNLINFGEKRGISTYNVPGYINGFMDFTGDFVKFTGEDFTNENTVGYIIEKELHKLNSSIYTDSFSGYSSFNDFYGHNFFGFNSAQYTGTKLYTNKIIPENIDVEYATTERYGGAGCDQGMVSVRFSEKYNILTKNDPDAGDFEFKSKLNRIKNIFRSSTRKFPYTDGESTLNKILDETPPHSSEINYITKDVWPGPTHGNILLDFKIDLIKLDVSYGKKNNILKTDIPGFISGYVDEVGKFHFFDPLNTGDHTLNTYLNFGDNDIKYISGNHSGYFIEEPVVKISGKNLNSLSGIYLKFSIPNSYTGNEFVIASGDDIEPTGFIFNKIFNNHSGYIENDRWLYTGFSGISGNFKSIYDGNFFIYSGFSFINGTAFDTYRYTGPNSNNTGIITQTNFIETTPIIYDNVFYGDIVEYKQPIYGYISGVLNPESALVQSSNDHLIFEEIKINNINSFFSGFQDERASSGIIINNNLIQFGSDENFISGSELILNIPTNTTIYTQYTGSGIISVDSGILSFNFETITGNLQTYSGQMPIDNNFSELSGILIGKIGYKTRYIREAICTGFLGYRRYLYGEMMETGLLGTRNLLYTFGSYFEFDGILPTNSWRAPTFNQGFNFLELAPPYSNVLAESVKNIGADTSNWLGIITGENGYITNLNDGNFSPSFQESLNDLFSNQASHRLVLKNNIDYATVPVYGIISMCNYTNHECNSPLPAGNIYMPLYYHTDTFNLRFPGGNTTKTDLNGNLYTNIPADVETKLGQNNIVQNSTWSYTPRTSQTPGVPLDDQTSWGCSYSENVGHILRSNSDSIQPTIQEIIENIKKNGLPNNQELLASINGILSQEILDTEVSKNGKGHFRGDYFWEPLGVVNAVSRFSSRLFKKGGTNFGSYGFDIQYIDSIGHIFAASQKASDDRKKPLIHVGSTRSSYMEDNKMIQPFKHTLFPRVPRNFSKNETAHYLNAEGKTLCSNNAFAKSISIAGDANSLAVFVNTSPFSDLIENIDGNYKDDPRVTLSGEAITTIL